VGEAKVGSLLRTKVEVALFGEAVARMPNVITAVASTGEIADDKLYTLPIENAMRVRTG
jgi:nitrogen regulatory protein PII